jgi:hypothetical protein
MDKTTQKLLNEALDKKIQEMSNELDKKLNLLIEVDAHDLEFEKKYVLKRGESAPKRIIFKGRGRKGKGDSDSQTYHFEDENGNDIMLSKKGVKNKINNVQEMTKINLSLREMIHNELEEKLHGGQTKLDKNHNGKIDAEDFKMLRKGKKTETDENMDYSHIDEKLHGGQKKLDKNHNGKIDAEDFKMLRKGKKSEMDEDLGGMEDSHPEFGDVNFGKLTHKEKMEKFPRYYNPLSLKDKRKNDDSEDEIDSLEESVNYRLKLTENIQLDLTEDEFVDFIEELVNEEMSKGMAEYNKNSKLEKKINNDATREVAKKMTDYLKDASKGKYEMNPKHFPKGNGELAKMDKKAYVPSDAVKDFTDNFTAAALENLDYDEIHPDEDWVTDNVKGSSRTGNNPEWANAVETPVNDKRNQIRKDNMLAKLKRKAYNKSAQPVLNDKTGQDAGDKIMMKLESKNFETEQNKLIIEEFDKIMRLMDYNKKTQ